MTGDELAGMPEPAQRLGVIADDATTAAVDDLARLLGAAVGAREIPLVAVTALAEAVAIMALAPDGPGQPASVIARDGERRWEQAKAKVTAEAAGTFDVSEAVAALHAMRDVGNAVLGALGDRRVPDEALMHLTMLFAAVAQGDVGLEAL